MKLASLVMLALALAPAAAFADLIAVTQPQRDEPQLNRFDTPEYDRVRACSNRLARSFRYDFDHPEIPATKQALNAFYDVCKTEIAALVAAFPNWTAYAPRRASFKSRVESNVLSAFQNALYDNYRSEVPDPPLPPVGASALRRESRVARVAHPSSLSPDEVAHVYRQDAYGYGSDIGFHGTFDGWQYTYEANRTSGVPPKAWQGYIDKGGVEAWANCFSWNDVDRACTISLASLLKITVGGAPLKITSVCDAGGQGMVLDAPDPPNIKARESTLIIDDDAPIALPDGDGCVADPDGQLAARILAAHKFTARYKPPFSDRFETFAGSADFLKPALILAQRINAITRDAQANAQILADIKDAVDRTPPFTLIDALRGEYEWQRAVACLHRNGPGRCEAPLRDLDWRAARIGAGLNEVPYDNPAALPGAAARIAQALQAAQAEATETSAQPSDHFAAGESAVSVAGAPGWRGYASLDIPCCSPAAYGYRVDGARALGFVTGPMDDQWVATGPAAFATITVECKAGRAPHCRIRVPFEAGNGAFIIDTDGGRADAKLCVEGIARPLHGWALMQRYTDKRWKLQSDGCAGPAPVAALTSMMSEHTLAAVAPGEKSDDAKHLSWRAELHLALALTAYLSERLVH